MAASSCCKLVIYSLTVLLSLIYQSAFAFIESDVKADFSIIAEGPMQKGVGKLSVHMKVPPGWKTFGREPGDIGEATTFTLKAPENLSMFDIHWPKTTPHKVYDFNINIYQGDVVFPVDIAKAKPNLRSGFKLDIYYNLCKLGECLPKKETLTYEIK